MTPTELADWQRAKGFTQHEAAKFLGISRSGYLNYLNGNRPIPDSIALKCQGDGQIDPTAIPGVMRASDLVPVEDDMPDFAPVTDDPNVVSEAQLAEAMKRRPPYATTAAEAKAMRHKAAEMLGLKPPEGGVSQVQLVSLQPVWRKLPSGRRVNAAIPQPMDVEPPSWAGPRGVVTRSGRVYDYEAAHEMRQLSGFVGAAAKGLWPA